MLLGVTEGPGYLRGFRSSIHLKFSSLAGVTLVVALALLATAWFPTSVDASGPTTLGRTGWQVTRPYGPVQTPAYSPLGNAAFYNYIPSPGVPGANDAGWSDCGPSNGLCPSADTINMHQWSRLGGFYACGASADYTFFQSFVSVPEGTSITQFSVNMSGADDGARVAIYNSVYPGGYVFPGSYIYLGGSQSTTDMSSAMVAGEVNRVVVTQMDNCAVGNNLDSAVISLNGTVIPSDSTPPVITPNVSGTLGNNGWYVSDVAVSWTVTDADSAVTSTTGCDATAVTADTTGTTFTCTATSAGGTASESVTVQRDATAPTATATRTPDANANGWNNSDVTVTFAGSDSLSGIASCDAAVVLGEGAGQSASGTCTDNAGNVSAPATVSDINVDETAPSATATRTPDADANGWNNSDVTVTFAGSDSLSGIASCDAAVVLGEGAGQSASGTCTDLAGNVSAPATVSDINVDETAPVVTVTGVSDGATYIVGGAPEAGCTTADGLSGVATDAVATVTGGPLGSVTVTCDGAEDLAGNMASVSATYAVAYDFCGFEQPLLTPVQVFKIKSTIPVKFCLADASGAPDGTAVASVYANGVLQGVARYDDTDGHYIFNLRTKGMAAGPLTISVSLDDGTTHSIEVALK